MSKKEELAREYTDKEVRRYHKLSGMIEKYGMERARRLSEHESWELEEAFEAGWDSALKSQWIRVEERMPDTRKKVLVLTSNKKVVVSFRYIPKDCYGNVLGEAEWNGSRAFGDSVIAWMPIPSFDEILESNKDVLKRLKDK